MKLFDKTFRKFSFNELRVKVNGECFNGIRILYVGNYEFNEEVKLFFFKSISLNATTDHIHSDIC